MTDHIQTADHDLETTHPTLLDPVEEACVEVSEMHASRREAELNAYFANRQPSLPGVSEAQLAANRVNAQLSTGPVSTIGKSISARNNFRHGLTQVEGDLVLLETESQEEYSHSLAEFQAEWQPATATERDLVERLASRQWLRRRAMKLQKYYVSPSDGAVIDYQQFALYRRYEIQHERAYNKALNDLIRLRALRLREKIGFESQERKNKEHQFKLRTLQTREKLQELAIRTAETRAALLEHRFLVATTPKNDKNSPQSAQ